MIEITRAQHDRCTTHHYACDCREFERQEMEKELVSLRAELEQTIKHVGHWQTEYYKMVKERDGWKIRAEEEHQFLMDALKKSMDK